MEEREFREFAVHEIANLYPHVNYDEHTYLEDINCDWICSSFNNITGLFSTKFNDGLFFKVTHDGSTGQSKIESYRKIADNLYF